MKESEKYIAECDCKMILDKWIPNEGDRFIYRDDGGKTYCYIGKSPWLPSSIWLPTIDQIIDLIGDRFLVLELWNDDDGTSEWECSYRGKPETDVGKSSKSPQLALIKALKIILKEEKK